MYIFLPAQIFAFLSNIIFCSEIIADIPCLKKAYLNPQNPNIRNRLIALRLCIWTTTTLMSVATDNFDAFLQAAGSIFTPICSFFIPVLLYHIIKKHGRDNRVYQEIGEKENVSQNSLFLGVELENFKSAAYLLVCSAVTWIMITN